MAYATPEEVRAVLAPDPTTGGVPELTDPQLQGSIDTASGQVEAAVVARYLVPFNPTPRLIHDIVVAIAAWWATLTYQRSVNIEANDPAALRYQWATAQLDKLSSGALDLPDADGTGSGTAPAETGGGATVVNPYRGRLFDMEDFRLTNRSSYGRGTPYGDW